MYLYVIIHGFLIFSNLLKIYTINYFYQYKIFKYLIKISTYLISIPFLDTLILLFITIISYNF